MLVEYSGIFSRINLILCEKVKAMFLVLIWHRGGGVEDGVLKRRSEHERRTAANISPNSDQPYGKRIELFYLLLRSQALRC